MSKYTIDLYSLLKDNNFNIFNFDYDFYTEDLIIKQSFESKFIDRYLFHEIGFETVSRFKHYLKQKLNNIAPYYKQLYETEVRSKGIDFMLNKDLTETFERNITENKNSNMINNSLNNLNSSDLLNSDFKESAIDNGVASLDLNAGSVTSVNKTSNTSSNNTSSTSNDASNVKSDNVQKEITKLISQGNIGVTSSAELLEKWRRVLINIDNLIIEDCENLFMKIY